LEKIKAFAALFLTLACKGLLKRIQRYLQVNEDTIVNS